MDAARRVLVVGDGGWGTALSMLLAAKGCAVSLWSYDAEYAALLSESRTNPRYLPGFKIPDSVRIGADFEALIDGSELLVSAVPTNFLRSVWKRHAPHLPAHVPLVSVSKGIEDGTFLRPTQILGEVLGDHPVAVLSGPNIAREIADGHPAVTVVASEDASLTPLVQHTFNCERLRVYSNPDARGVELGGVLKNVIAIAAGMCDGLQLGANAKAALVTRGVVEMARLGQALGGQRATFFGISGLGDLLTTCYSPLSRNRTFGERLGRGELAADISASMKMVAEGARSARPLNEIMHERGLRLPITEQVHLAIHEGKPAKAVLESLMRRTVKDEAEDLP